MLLVRNQNIRFVFCRFRREAETAKNKTGPGPNIRPGPNFCFFLTRLVFLDPFALFFLTRGVLFFLDPFGFFF